MCQKLRHFWAYTDEDPGELLRLVGIKKGIWLMGDNSKMRLGCKEAKEALICGNREYVKGLKSGDISEERRENTFSNGQSPYAVVVACADSRVPVEYIFGAGVGDLFIIRTAGNVVGDYELGSVEYGVGHLGAKLVVVLGHTGCGAVEATLAGGAEGHVQAILDEIQMAIGEEKGQAAAEDLNVKNSIRRILESPVIRECMEHEGVEVVGAKYDTRTGTVQFMD